MAQAQAVGARGSLVTRRNAIALIVVAAILALAAGLAANSYISSEAQRVAAPQRGVWVAARDLPGGTLVGEGDLERATMPIPDSLQEFYAPADIGAAALRGITVHALRKGQPITAGDVLPPEAATTVSPLVPRQVTVGGAQRTVVGALNIPLDRLVAPPPDFATNDRIDLWVFAGGQAGQAGAGRTEAVLSDIQVITFVRTGERREGIVVAVTEEQLNRFLSVTTAGAPLLITVRPAPRR